MEETMIFSILELQITKEESLIRDAYRKLLVKVNPEDNPEGFKRLRQAYEEALAYARELDTNESDELEAIETQTPIQLWMDKIKAIYTSLSKRLDESYWKEVLQEEVCINLDASIEARDTLISFLENHYMLRTVIWKLLDKTFLLCDRKNELYEKFPNSFVNYIIKHCNQSENEDFPYHLLAGDDNADYDSFLYYYIELTKYINQENWDEAAKLLELFDTIPIYHPFLIVEKAYYEQACGNGLKALELINPILEKLSEYPRVSLVGAKILWNVKQFDQAIHYFEQVLENEPSNYTANKYIGQYYLEKKDYHKAKGYYITVYEISNEEEFLTSLNKINNHLIKAYEQNPQKEYLDFQEHLEIGWCCLQNCSYLKGIEILTNRESPPEYQMEYYNLLGKLYFGEQQYDISIKQFETVILLINSQCNIEEEKTRYRLGHLYEMLALIYFKKALQDNTFSELAIQTIKQAISYDPQNIGYLWRLANFYIDQKSYEKAIDICDQMKRLDKTYFWTYILYQKAYYELRSAQEVIDYFYEAKNIHPYYSKMYELATTVFINFHQWKEALGILNQAKEYNLSNNELSLLEVTIYRRKSKSTKQLKKAFKRAKKVQSKFKETNASNTDLAEIAFELAQCCWRMDWLTLALTYINEAISLKEQDEYVLLKASILFDQDEFSQSLQYFLICKEVYKNDEFILERIGYCYKSIEDAQNKLNNYFIAATYYEKVIKINPENIRAHNVLFNIYKWSYRETGDTQYYDKGISIASQIIVLAKRNLYYYYIERGLLYMDADIWDKALADFEKSSELFSENVYPYINIGCIYKYTEQYDLAIKFFTKAAEIMKSNETPKVYGNLGDCYERMGEKEKAIKAYQKNKELFPEDISISEDIIDLYRSLKQYEKALEVVEEIYSSDCEDYYITKGDIYLDMGLIDDGINCYKQFLIQDQASTNAYQSLGNAYLYCKQQMKDALDMYEKALACCEEGTEEHQDICVDMMCYYYLLGECEKGKRYFDFFTKYYETYRGGFEKYMNSKYYSLARIYPIACAYIYIGDIEKAEQLVKRMSNGPKCRHCTNLYCYEYYMLKALLEEQKGEKEKALSSFQKVLSIKPNFLFCKMKIKQLSK